MSRSLPLVLLFVCFANQTVLAQSPNKHGWVYQAFPSGYGWLVPRESPPAALIQEVGVTEVMIRYSRPFVKERDVWGGLVPLDKVWRAGANEATVISFSTDVVVGNSPLPAGTYALFLDVKSTGDWEFVFSNRPEQWGAFTYTPAEEIARAVATVRDAPHQESLLYLVPEVTDSTAQVMLHWGDKQVSFSMGVNTPLHAQQLTNANFDWQAAWFAADYFLNKAKDLDEASKWSTIALALTRNTGTLLLRAKVLAEFKQYDEAIALAEEAYQQRAHPSFQEHIDTWKAARDNR